MRWLAGSLVGWKNSGWTSQSSYDYDRRHRIERVSNRATKAGSRWGLSKVRPQEMFLSKVSSFECFYAISSQDEEIWILNTVIVASGNRNIYIMTHAENLLINREVKANSNFSTIHSERPENTK